jgi:hypothetical protein
VAGRPPGSRVRLRALHWDGELPVAGDFLRTASGSCYLIEEARPGRGRTVAVFVCRKLEERCGRVWLTGCSSLDVRAAAVGCPG